jgi:hypothetical protein
MRRLAVLAAILACVVPIAAMGQATPTTGTASPAASPAASDVGKTVRWGDWEITLKSAAFAPSVVPESNVAKTARGKYVVVRFGIVNRSLSPMSTPYRDIMVRDAKGRSFSLDYDATAAVMIVEQDMIPGADSLQPDIPYDAAYVFDVATDASDLVLVLPGTEPVELRLGI